ncbi:MULTISPECIES: hypothetical protein [unclassified Pseudomonas]|uniref:hypothetical protein n=1 Tax=unclassified Pseudomonas TaxID=196821 RepID=UPI00244A9841|nr:MULTISPECIES: hypothetical protein [unclassified Pseudomonas]MDH0304711.1 hypothetical protein [Pseudomonas sp. GD04091]MDH1986914.1 hypothetical protein [Pseudomonas sp. GD03689]
MSTRKRIDGLRRQVSTLSEDQAVMEISKIMDELSAAAAGGSGAKTNDLATLFSDLEAEQKTTPKGIEPCN